MGGQKAAALVRQFSANLIRTTLAFKIDGGPAIHLFQQTRFPTDVFNRSEFKQPSALKDSSAFAVMPQNQKAGGTSEAAVVVW